MPTPLDKTIAFLGAGNMGAAMAREILAAGVAEPHRLLLSDVRQDHAAALAAELGCRAAADNREAAAASDVIVLAVKPQVIREALADVSGAVTPSHLVLSIAAGVPISALEAGLPAGVPVVRVMPNISCQVGEGMSVYSPGSSARPEHLQVARTILEAVGRAEQAEERLLDAVTGLSGSGPAFVFIVIEALADGGVRMGLPRDLAQTLAVQTVLGAAKMVRETGLHPAELKDRVCSPGGTTIAGVAALEAAGVRSAMIRAVEAAARRAGELAPPEPGPRGEG